MTTAEFRRIALSLPGAEESFHMGSPDFRVGNRIFATQPQGYGNVMLTTERQSGFVAEQPGIFVPIPWRKGQIRRHATEAIVEGALRTAGKLRLAKNARPAAKKTKAR